MGASAAALLGPIWTLLLAGVTGAAPYRPEQGRCRSEFEYLARNLGVCCSKCPPGFFARSQCTGDKDTVCAPCGDDEYTELWNYVRECRVCPTCDPRRNVVVAVNCTARRRTRCACRPGHHCVGDCTDCEAHSLCGPGRQVALPGTLLRDTECERCPAGTFKADSSLETCRNHTNCRTRGLSEIALGTDVSDSVCAPALTETPPEDVPAAPTKSEQLETGGRGILVPVLIVSTISICSFLLLVFLGFRQRFLSGRTEKTQPPADADQTSVESGRPLLGSQPVFHEPQRQTFHEPQRQTFHEPQPTAGPRETQQTQQAGADGGSVGRPASNPAQSQQGQARGLLGLQACQVNTLNSNLTVHGPLYIYNGDAAPARPPGSEGAPRREGGVGATLGGGAPVSASPEQETGEDPIRGCRPGPLILGVSQPQQEVGEGWGVSPTVQAVSPPAPTLPHPSNPLS